MRRQARNWGGGAHFLRTASALQGWLWLVIFVFQNEFRISRSIQPGYLDFDNLPETNFTCAGKVIGGYYADLETSCQMFHVCTVGQQEETMDIKFLCLNGTVFDQETRVCERVDEVDCTKSEKFYSLNLELYGSTAPPIIQPEQVKPQSKPTEQSRHVSEPEVESDPFIDESTRHDNDKDRLPEIHDSTDDPSQDGSFDQDHNRHQTNVHPVHPASEQFSPHVEPSEENQEEDEEVGDNLEYDDFTPAPTTTTTAATTTSPKPPLTTTVHISSLSSAPPTVGHAPPTPSSHAPIAPAAPSPSVVLSAPASHQSPISRPTFAPSAHQSPPSRPMPSHNRLEPAFLTPQEFIYRHRGPGSEAISFQSFRPADDVYITHAPPQQFDHFQYESSRTAPRSPGPRADAFAQRTQPAPFRATTPDSRDQLLRPGPASQPSERHETTVKHRHQYNSPRASLPGSRPLPLEPFHYDYKRSQDPHSENPTSLAARSAASPSQTNRPPSKPKSPPRVIVTASASVSDSNGKRLNYTVGNVVSAVKPIVPINYDDYKESDLIFDPFFLDVPKLQKRRKNRSNDKIIITVPLVTIATPTVTSAKGSPVSGVPAAAVPTATAAAWNPDDYVDDNYEPQAYQPAMPPLAALLSIEKQYLLEKQPHKYTLKDDRNHVSRVHKLDKSKSALLTRTQTPSSQSPARAASHVRRRRATATRFTSDARLVSS